MLESRIAPILSKVIGRPGMPLWAILVCGTIRLDLNCDYDRLHDLANHHSSLRDMLGHGAFNDTRYNYQTIKDTGVWLCNRRLHRGRFIWPRADTPVFNLSARQRQSLVTGVDWQRLGCAIRWKNCRPASIARSIRYCRRAPNP